MDDQSADYSFTLTRMAQRAKLIVLIAHTAPFEVVSGAAAAGWAISLFLFSEDSPVILRSCGWLALAAGLGQLLGVVSGWLHLRGASATAQAGLWLFVTILSTKKRCPENLLLLVVWSLASLWLVFRLRIRLLAARIASAGSG